ncbi:MAG: AAA family ATPase [Deltaproteobacteria bacterium]
MERIIFFGKGGIGKSTTSTNVSTQLAALGHRVLHVGCDPKHDSTVALLGGRLLQPVVDKIVSTDGVTPEDIVVRSPLGIDCVEAGGPEAGVGCGGRGVTRMMEIFAAAKLLTSGRYDVTVYDVLGDVVCGGFAAPLRKNIGEKVVIVASEELMSLYAANNIARAVCHYASNGVGLAGMIVNLRDNHEDRAPIERFARLINTNILGYIPRDPLIHEAEYRQQTVVEYAPHSAIAGVFRDLAEKILAIDPKALSLPTPLDEAKFYEYTRTKFEVPVRREGDARVPNAATRDDPDRLVPAQSLLGPRVLEARDEAARAAAERAADFTAEWHAGVRAVRMGRVSVSVALERLRGAFPREALELAEPDLLA